MDLVQQAEVEVEVVLQAEVDRKVVQAEVEVEVEAEVDRKVVLQAEVEVEMGLDGDVGVVDVVL